jgi:Ca2+-binding EF-hand superfamily protein
MKTSVKFALATCAVGIAGTIFLAGSSYADRGFGPRFGMGGHGMGHGGPMVREMLANVDTDEDGAISQEEINVAIDARFTEFDADTDGNLSLEEFQALWAEITRPMTVRAFQFLDPDGDAAVSRDELDDRFGSAVAQFDRNDDGVLSPDDHRRRGGRGGPGGGHGPRWHHGHGPQMDRDGPDQQ